MSRFHRIAIFSSLALLIGASVCAQAQNRYKQTNLVSDLSTVGAAHVDPNLKNPWGIAFGPGSPFWISDNNAGVTTIYNGGGATARPPVILPPPAGSMDIAHPTGQVFNPHNAFSGTPEFSGDIFIFATEDGTVSGWKPANGNNAQFGLDNSASGAVYKGLALNTSANSVLFAANFNSGNVDMINNQFALSGSFTDPNLPNGYAPFNVQNIGGQLYVTFAKQKPDKHDDMKGAGHGFIDVFNTDGTFNHRFATGTDAGGTVDALNSPWGLALAPKGFGKFGGDLLVGNFGDGVINAFDANGNFVGQLDDAAGKPLTIDGLWGLSFGGGGNGGDKNRLYFTAGINEEANGLFGSLQAVPEPGATTLLLGALSSVGFFLRRRKS